MEYEAATEFIINNIKRTFDRGNNIAQTLRTLQKQETDDWMPIIKTSNADEQENIARGNRHFELEYKAKLYEAVKRVDKYHQNLYKAYFFYGKSVVAPCKTK